MEWKIIRFEEGTDFDRDKKAFVRFKRAVFEVNGTEHTLRISMKDFDEGKTNQIIAAEVSKIESVIKGTGTDKRR